MQEAPQGQITKRAPDPRTRRTRAAIVRAMAQLLGEGRSDFVVRDLVQLAGVSRATFYTHFASIDDVAVELLREKFGELSAAYRRERERAGERTAQAVWQGQHRLAEVFWQQRELLRPLMECSFAAPSYVAIVRAFADSIEGILEAERARVPAGIDLHVMAFALSNSLIGLLTAWVAGKVEGDLDTIVTHLVALLPPWVGQPDLPAADTAAGGAVHADSRAPENEER